MPYETRVAQTVQELATLYKDGSFSAASKRARV